MRHELDECESVDFNHFGCCVVEICGYAFICIRNSPYELGFLFGRRQQEVVAECIPANYVHPQGGNGRDLRVRIDLLAECASWPCPHWHIARQWGQGQMTHEKGRLWCHRRPLCRSVTSAVGWRNSYPKKMPISRSAEAGESEP